MSTAEPAGAESRGFPSSARATAVPNLFFSRLLPQIEKPEELLVTVYFFFAQQFVRRRPRYLTAGELAADAGLTRALVNLCDGSPAECLDRGVALAVERGTLVERVLKGGEGGQSLYAVNTPANRRALQATEPGAIAPGRALQDASGEPLPNIFTLYEENIGVITPMIAEQLKQAEGDYPEEWLERAFREATELNKRSWRYIQTILTRWEAEGPDYEKRERNTELEWLERRYREHQLRRARA